MTLAIVVEPTPLEVDANGVVRVGQTRVTLDTVVTAFLEGATAEEIGEQYTSLQLSDIYSVLGYYLKHKAEVDAYLLERQRQAAVIRREAEQRFDPVGIRDCPRGTALRAIAYWLDEVSTGNSKWYDSEVIKISIIRLSVVFFGRVLVRCFNRTVKRKERLETGGMSDTIYSTS